MRHPSTKGSKMFRQITAATLALTLALPTPSRAEDLDTAGKVLGLLSLFAIVHMATKDNNARPAPVVTPRPKPHPQPHPQPRPRPQVQKTLPAECVYQNHDAQGPRRLISKRCLRRSDVHVRHLPRACEMTGLNRRGEFKGYRIRCMKRLGWRFH